MAGLGPITHLPPIPQDVFIDVARDYQVVRVSAAAATCWLLYDWVIRFSDEVELVWKSANTLPKFLYFVSRYFGILTQLVYIGNVFPLYCSSHLAYKAAAYFILHGSVELSLIVRVYALYNRSRKMLIFLLVTFIAEEITLLVMLFLALSLMVGHVFPFPPGVPLPGCIVAFTPAFYNACWIPILIYETSLLILNTIKCISYRPLTHTPLIVRLLRDGSIYFVVMCVSLLLRTISQYRPDLLNGEIIDTWMTATFSLAGSHLMLSVRSLAAEKQRMDIATPKISIGVLPANFDHHHHHHHRTCHYPSPSKATDSDDMFELSPIERSPTSPSTSSTVGTTMSTQKEAEGRLRVPFGFGMKRGSLVPSASSSDLRLSQQPHTVGVADEDRTRVAVARSLPSASDRTRQDPKLLTVQTSFLSRNHSESRPQSFPHPADVEAQHNEPNDDDAEHLPDTDEVPVPIPIIRRTPFRSSSLVEDSDNFSHGSHSRQHLKTDEDPSASRSHPPIPIPTPTRVDVSSFSPSPTLQHPSPPLNQPSATVTGSTTGRSPLAILCMGKDRKWLDDWAVV